MILKVYNIDVPITPGVMPPVIHIGQYDSGREYIAHLKNDDGTDYTIPANSTATFTGCNPRKEVFEIECNITNNAVIFVPQDEATSMWGKYGATLNITSGGEKMSPIVLLMDVQKAGATDEEIAGAANFPDAVTEAVNDFLEEALEEGDLGSLYVTKAAQIPATSGMTQPVGITPEGQLVTTPGGGGEASVTPASIVTATEQMTTTQKASTRSNIGAGTYSKPSGGVPKTDLASAVQTSLGKADTAYQKPSGGIPSTDMAQAVQTALTAAGTAVQPSDLASYVPRGKQATKSVNDTVRVAIASDGTLYVPTYPEGGGGTPAAENTRLITMTYYDGDTYASDTAAQIYDILQDGAVNLVLIDRAGRECYLVKPPESDSGATCIAKFATYDESADETIIYTINASGVVSSASVGGYYTKPSGGIPYTDLASAVQASLDKADTAYQKPDGGITKADLTSAIRNSLGKADSAYQLPLTGIPLTDIANQGSANANKIFSIGSDGSVVLEPSAKILTMTKSGSTYTYTGANFSFTTLADLQAFVSAGTILWLVNTTTGSAYQSVNSRGASSTARLTFAGPTLEADNDDLTVEAFIFDGQMNITRKELTAGGSGPAIPTPTQSDNGKYLGVVNGAYALRTAPSGGGVTLYTVTAVYRSGYWYIQHDGSDIAAEDIFTALFGGALVQFTDDAGAEGEMIEVYYDGPGTGHIVYKTSNMDNNVPGWRLFDITDEIVQSAPRAEVTMTPVELLPVSDSRTASQVGSGFTVEGNTVYTVSGTISGFTLITSTKPTMLPGQCIEIRLTVGSSAITTPTWPSWMHLMNGWDGKFEASTYYDIVIDDVGNVYAGSREVS